MERDNREVREGGIKMVIECIKDVTRSSDGAIVFKAGNSYQVEDKGDRYITVDELGDKQEVIKGSPQEDALLGVHFKW